MYDIDQTILHEAVAHLGLRKNVFNSASKDVRGKIVSSYSFENLINPTQDVFAVAKDVVMQNDLEVGNVTKQALPCF